MPETGKRVDPYGNYNFALELDGILGATFHDVTGFDSTIDVIEHREGGQNLTPYKFPGMTKYSNIVLKWGLTDDRRLYDWHRQVVEGVVERKGGAIVILDRQGNQKARWEFKNAWPTKYDGPDLNAEGNDIAIETLELAHEGLVRVS